MYARIFSAVLDRIRPSQVGRNLPGPQAFAIGLPKSGTTSITDALTILGYNAIHYSPCFRIAGEVPVFSWPWWLNRFNAHADIPVAHFFKEIDQRFPDSRFILTTRTESAWLDSSRRHFTARRELLDKQSKRFRPALILSRTVFGSCVFDESKFLKAYKSHTNSVLDHFNNRDNLFVMDVTDRSVSDSLKWQRLCEFLDKSMPATPFPHSNASKQSPPPAESA